MYSRTMLLKSASLGPCSQLDESDHRPELTGDGIMLGTHTPTDFHTYRFSHLLTSRWKISQPTAVSRSVLKFRIYSD